METQTETMIQMLKQRDHHYIQTVMQRCLCFSGSLEGGGGELSFSGQTQPVGEERVKSGAGARERRPTDTTETAEL